MIPDWLMLAVHLIGVGACVWFGRGGARQGKRREPNYIIGVWWTTAFALLSLFYAALTFGWEARLSPLEIRVTLFRPAHIFLVLGILTFLFNGRLNAFIARVHRRCNEWIRTRLAR